MALYRLNLGYVIGMHVNIFFVIVRTSLVWRIINNQQKVLDYEFIVTNNNKERAQGINLTLITLPLIVVKDKGLLRKPNGWLVRLRLHGIANCEVWQRRHQINYFFRKRFPYYLTTSKARMLYSIIIHGSKILQNV